MREVGERAKAASAVLARLSSADKDKAIMRMADAIDSNTEAILSANHKDVLMAESKGMRKALLDRLALDERKIKRISNGVREVALLSDPVGVITSTVTRPNGLIIGQMRVPLGVVGVIYESRPDVTSDASSICLKAGNSVILRGGSDAINSNVAMGNVLREALVESNIPVDAIQVVNSTDRRETEELMRMREFVDVLIPRGGASLIKSVLENATVPVIETGTGNCHIYVEDNADYDQAEAIIINAKCQRPGTCNAAEKLLVNQSVAKIFLPKVIDALRRNGVEVRGCSRTIQIVPDIIAASEEDWGTEYLDLIIGIKVVDTLDEAIAHINRYGSKHSDSILTASFEKALRFIKEVDSSAVYWNASTRFTDGNQFGLGAEIGVSTQKLHARGPLSAQHLTTTKYFIFGKGQVRE